MTRIARFVIPCLPHCVTQRGNRYEPLFLEGSDYELYRDLLAAQCRRHGTSVWSYCLMPNHVHLILVPNDAQGLSRTIGETHRRYSRILKARSGRSGRIFQDRFHSVAMDEEHLMAAVRFIATNPVRSGLVKRPPDWPWSSARALLTGRDDALVQVSPVLARCNGKFADFLETVDNSILWNSVLAAETIGRPLGSREFLDRVMESTGREPRPRKRGPKPKEEV